MASIIGYPSFLKLLRDIPNPSSISELDPFFTRPDLVDLKEELGPPSSRSDSPVQYATIPSSSRQSAPEPQHKDVSASNENAVLGDVRRPFESEQLSTYLKPMTFILPSGGFSFLSRSSTELKVKPRLQIPKRKYLLSDTDRVAWAESMSQCGPQSYSWQFSHSAGALMSWLSTDGPIDGRLVLMVLRAALLSINPERLILVHDLLDYLEQKILLQTFVSSLDAAAMGELAALFLLVRNRSRLLLKPSTKPDAFAPSLLCVATDDLTRAEGLIASLVNYQSSHNSTREAQGKLASEVLKAICSLCGGCSVLYVEYLIVTNASFFQHLRTEALFAVDALIAPLSDPLKAEWLGFCCSNPTQAINPMVHSSPLVCVPDHQILDLTKTTHLLIQTGHIGTHLSSNQGVASLHKLQKSVGAWSAKAIQPATGAVQPATGARGSLKNKASASDVNPQPSKKTKTIVMFTEEGAKAGNEALFQSREVVD